MSDAAQEIAELTRVAQAYDARHEFIPALRWPGGARIAVNLTADFDAMLLRRLMNEPAGQLAKGEFGGRVGIWRLLELFESHHVKATIFTPGRICELYPQSLRAAVRGGHEIADHMWEHHVPKDAALEADHLLKTTAALERIAGRRPVGTRSDHTRALLKREGFIYTSHDSAAHLPYYVHDTGVEKSCVLNLPFHYAIDDAMFYSFAWLGSGNSAQRISDPDRVFDLWWAAFEQQYRVGGYLNIVMHPFVSGRALRIAMMDRLIAKMKTLPGVWFATCEEVARHVLATCPATRG
jgi:peptidoglycan/xylan/chitin deacetylase (PgdA/CDA1 family)